MLASVRRAAARWRVEIFECAGVASRDALTDRGARRVGAARGLDEARGGASVAVVGVSVVALLEAVEHAVAAAARVFDGTGGRAPVAVIGVSVVTLFAGVHGAVATEGAAAFDRDVERERSTPGSEPAHVDHDDLPCGEVERKDRRDPVAVVVAAELGAAARVTRVEDSVEVSGVVRRVERERAGARCGKRYREVAAAIVPATSGSGVDIAGVAGVASHDRVADRGRRRCGALARRLDGAGRGASVSVVGVSVIALFGAGDRAVATDVRGAVKRDVQGEPAARRAETADVDDHRLAGDEVEGDLRGEETGVVVAI